jgi:hypothetical protein
MEELHLFFHYTRHKQILRSCMCVDLEMSEIFHKKDYNNNS